MMQVWIEIAGIVVPAITSLIIAFFARKIALNQNKMTLYFNKKLSDGDIRDKASNIMLKTSIPLMRVDLTFEEQERLRKEFTDNLLRHIIGEFGGSFTEEELKKEIMEINEKDVFKGHTH